MISVTSRLGFVAMLAAAPLAAHSAAVAQGAASAVNLAPHIAIYDLTLTSSRGKRALESVRGRIVYDFSGSACEGYALNFRQVTELDSGEGKLVAVGKLGGAVSIEDGQKAARACAINLLAHLKVALGDLDKVQRVVRLGGFINAMPDFLETPKVMNGASDLMVTAFGDKGRHARTTIGVAVLPMDAAVEVEGMFEVS